MIRSALLCAVLVALVAGVSAAVPLKAGLEVRVVPAAPRQGDVVMLFVSGVRHAREMEGSLGGRPLAFFPYGVEYAALAGLDLETKPGRVAWSVRPVRRLLPAPRCSTR